MTKPLRTLIHEALTARGELDLTDADHANVWNTFKSLMSMGFRIKLVPASPDDLAALLTATAPAPRREPRPKVRKAAERIAEARVAFEALLQSRSGTVHISEIRPALELASDVTDHDLQEAVPAARRVRPLAGEWSLTNYRVILD